MPYKEKWKQSVSTRGAVRSWRHGNWRQTYVDCLGMCVARVNGGDVPCGEVHSLELHAIWGERAGRLQQRVLLCPLHHALIEDRNHFSQLILSQYRPSCLPDDVFCEVELAGGQDAWIRKWRLDGSRAGSLLFSGPLVEDDC